MAATGNKRGGISARFGEDVGLETLASPIGDEMLVNTFTTGTQGGPSIARLTNGNTVITWGSSGQDGDSGGVYMKTYASSGNALLGETQVNVATIGNQNGSSVTALDNGGYVVVWQSLVITGSGPLAEERYEIFYRVYDGNGVAVTDPLIANSALHELEVFPRIAGLDGGGFAITWTVTIDGTPDQNEIYVRQFNDLGAPQDAETFANTTTAGTQTGSRIAALEGGGWVVMWNDIQGIVASVKAQRFGENGNKIGGEFLVHTTSFGNESAVAAKGVAGGGFVVLCSSAGPPDGLSTLYARRFDADGVALGAEFMVSEPFTTVSSGHSVTALADGGFLVTWTTGFNAGQDILARAYDANGVALEDAYTVNQTTAGTQGSPLAIERADGSLLFVWSGSGAGDSAGVFMRAFTAGSGAGPINGTEGPDDLVGTSADDVINGLGGNDMINGGAGADAIDGGDGTDTAGYAASAARVRINLTTGVALDADAQGDTFSGIENLIGSAFNDALTGAAGANTLTGGAGNDQLSGLAGNDVLRGGVGIDALNGGDNVDIADYSASAARVRVNLATGTGLDADAQGDTLSNIENLLGSAFNDILTGNGGANALSGGAGADTLVGGAGADALNGGDGVDAADYSASATRVRINLTTGVALDADAQGDTYVGVESLTGSAFNDLLTGDGGANTLAGGGGHDTLAGLDGADILIGGAGMDVLQGGDGVDTADYLSSAARVRVNLATGAGLDGDAQGDTLSSIENLTGSAFNDILVGTSGANALLGGAGADILRGGAGADVLNGGLGVDTLDYTSSAGRVRVSLATGAALDADAQGDVVTGIENLIGAAFNDILTGSASDNALNGAAGNDLLSGLAGVDTLTGGAGLDAFIFTTALGPIDVITDFSVADDTIRVDDAMFAGLPAGALAPGAFVIGASAADADDRLVYNAATGALSFDADGNGAGAAVQFATMSTGLALTNADFLVI
jgi:Ca2+-binding RTX toxin-like protein